jgi:hypothetical protein
LVFAAAFGLANVGTRADEVIFDLRIAGGRVPPDLRRIRVKQGDAVKLRWTTDRTIALHLHGYDIEKKVDPGVVAEMSFTARATGRFPISVHRPKAGGGHTHDPPIVQIEVHPR